MSFLGSCECHILELTSMAGQLSLDLALYLSNLYALPRLSLQKPAHKDSLANLRHLYFRAPRSSPSLYTECASPTVRPTSTLVLPYFELHVDVEIAPLSTIALQLLLVRRYACTASPSMQPPISDCKCREALGQHAADRW
jgi:hypothetical protein